MNKLSSRNLQHILLQQCSCCSLDDPGQILPTMPDISIAFKLHLESGQMINLFDWLQVIFTLQNITDAFCQFSFSFIIFRHSISSIKGIQMIKTKIRMTSNQKFSESIEMVPLWFRSNFLFVLQSSLCAPRC